MSEDSAYKRLCVWVWEQNLTNKMLQINVVHHGSEKSLNVKATRHLVAKMFIIQDI